MFISVQEVAKRLMVSQPTVRKLIENGEIKAMKVGNQYRITEADYQAYCEAALIR